ncbi:MAG: alpha-L-fucosidase [Acidimicrobiia bacterium]
MLKQGDWFDQARFGMFIHWDHASQHGLEVSWPMVGGVFSLPRCQSVTPDEYHGLAASFDPAAFDAADLARRAREAGMRYVVFTTRHHNGFSMFDSALSDHTVMHSPYGRDIVRDVADAFRAEGLRIGFYYSLSDWHHPDYPAFREEDKPYLPGLSPPRPAPEQADRFRGYLFGQLRELLTNYGPVDVLWFDGQWERSPGWWRVDEIAALARELQPGILINDRLPGHGDFLTPEQFVPPIAPGERWETCFTMNDSWGWNPDDTNYKSARAIVHALCETAGRGGNFLLNVSPRGDGALPAEQIERLDAVTAWMAAHDTAIHGTQAGLEPWQFYGPSTRRDNRVNVICLMRPYDTVTVRGLPVRRVERVAVVGTGARLPFSTRTGVLEALTADPDGEVTIAVPQREHDVYATILAIDFAAMPIEGRAAIGVVEAGS